MCVPVLMGSVFDGDESAIPHCLISQRLGEERKREGRGLDKAGDWSSQGLASGGAKENRAGYREAESAGGVLVTLLLKENT